MKKTGAVALLSLLAAFAASSALAANSPLAPVFPGASWAKKTPAEAGLNPAKLQEALNFLKTKLKIDRAILIRSGYAVWQGTDPGGSQAIWSANKAYTSTVAGLLFDDKVLTPESKAGDFAPSLRKSYPAVTIRHFLTMTSGYRNSGGGNADLKPGKPARKPGTLFEYHDPAMQQFAAVLTQAGKKSIKDIFSSRIAKPVGMKSFSWGVTGKVGNLTVNGGAGHTSSGIKTSANDIARLCYLFLREGNWNGKQLISREWVDMANQPQVPLSMPGKSGPGRYGFNWWTNGALPNGQLPMPAPPQTYLAAGAHSNVCIVIPEWDIVFARLGTNGGSDIGIDGFLERLGKAIQ